MKTKWEQSRRKKLEKKGQIVNFSTRKVSFFRVQDKMSSGCFTMSSVCFTMSSGHRFLQGLILAMQTEFLNSRALTLSASRVIACVNPDFLSGSSVIFSDSSEVLSDSSEVLCIERVKLYRHTEVLCMTMLQVPVRTVQENSHTQVLYVKIL